MMEEDFQVENPGVIAALRDLGRTVKKMMPTGWGFTLFMFDYGDMGSLFYLSSAKREDMLKVLREFIKKEEAKVKS